MRKINIRAYKGRRKPQVEGGTPWYAVVAGIGVFVSACGGLMYAMMYEWSNGRADLKSMIYIICAGLAAVIFGAAAAIVRSIWDAEA